MMDDLIHTKQVWTWRNPMKLASSRWKHSYWYKSCFLETWQIAYRVSVGKALRGYSKTCQFLEKESRTHQLLWIFHRNKIFLHLTCLNLDNLHLSWRFGTHQFKILAEPLTYSPQELRTACLSILKMMHSNSDEFSPFFDISEHKVELHSWLCTQLFKVQLRKENKTKRVSLFAAPPSVISKYLQKAQ